MQPLSRNQQQVSEVSALENSSITLALTENMTFFEEGKDEKDGKDGGGGD